MVGEAPTAQEGCGVDGAAAGEDAAFGDKVGVEANGAVFAGDHDIFCVVDAGGPAAGVGVQGGGG